MSGWICSYRQIWESPLFAGDAQRVGVWMWILHHAAWKPTKFRIGKDIIELARGQVCVSQRQIEAATGMGRTALRTFLKALEAEHAIELKLHQGATHGRTIITVCNYDKYQDSQDRANPASDPTATQLQPTKEQVNNIPPSEGASAPTLRAVDVDPINKAVWDFGVPFLSASGQKNPRAILGKWLKDAGDPQPVLAALRDAQKAGTGDPVPYIAAVLSGGKKSKQPKSGDTRVTPDGIKQVFVSPFDGWVREYA